MTRLIEDKELVKEYRRRLAEAELKLSEPVAPYPLQAHPLLQDSKKQLINL